MSEFRVEKDSMGDVNVPAKAYYGAQTQRAVDNFPISGQPLPTRLIQALGLVKVAAAVANRDLGKLKARPGRADHQGAAREVAEGKFDDQFPIDVYPDRLGHLVEHERQRGHQQSGHRADRRQPLRQEEADPSQRSRQHGPSTNDMFPTAIHVAAGRAIAKELMPALERLQIR